MNLVCRVSAIHQIIVNAWPEEALRVYAQIARAGMHKHLADIFAGGDIENLMRQALIQANRLKATHTALHNRGLVSKAFPYFGTGAVLFAVWGNSDAHAVAFENAFREYARAVRNNDSIGQELASHSVADACANLAGTRFPVWHNVWEALSP